MSAIRHEMRYGGATPEQVYAMLSTPEFREAVCEYQQFREHTVTITPTDAAMTVDVDQYRPADEVPGFARKFVGETINIVQHEQWSSHTAATLEVSIPGKPGEMKGTITLAADDAGTTETVAVDVTVNIPLVGRKIADFIGQMLLRALKAENKVGVKWLAEH